MPSTDEQPRIDVPPTPPAGAAAQGIVLQHSFWKMFNFNKWRAR